MLPDILDYSCYRTFLKDYAAAKKLESENWTFDSWALEMGLRNNTSILKIINGQRETGPNIRDKLIKNLNLSGKRETHFRDLIELSKVRNNPDESRSLIERVTKRKPDFEVLVLQDKTFGMISHWWYWALRQMARLSAFKNSDSVSARSVLLFSVSAREVTSAIKTLKRLNLWQPDRGKPKELRSTEDVPSAAIKNVHHEVLNLAQQSLIEVPVEEREITTLFLPFKSRDLKRAKELIRNFRDEFNKEFDSENGDRIYAVNFSFFPVTKPISKDLKEET